MNRRQFAIGAALFPFCPGLSLAGDQSVPIADMHFHLFFMGPRPAASQPLARNMASGGATLVSWSLVGDVPWLEPVAGGFQQKASPKGREASQWFERELGRIREHIAEQRLKVVETAPDIDEALAGTPHVVLSVEGAAFLDENLNHLARAHQLGIRHIQLVHFITNRIGDIQTARAVHGGLTDYGRRVIAECNRLGVLVDLAHCPDHIVLQALEVSTKPMVFSHGSVHQGGAIAARIPGWQARQLAVSTAKAIAAKGGVVGIWALGADVGTTPQSYAQRVLQLADWIGEDHVAFGTDMNALAKPAIRSFADLRLAVDYMQAVSAGRERIGKIASGNYARALRAALATA